MIAGSIAKFLIIACLFTSSYCFAETLLPSNHMETTAPLPPDKCRVDSLEPSPSSPPNNTDDPGTTAKGCFEFNLTAGLDHSKDAEEVKTNFKDFALDMNYGATESLQAKVVVHLISQTVSTDDHAPVAPGRIEIGAKQRIYSNEENQFDISLFPTIDFLPSAAIIRRKGLPDSGTNLTFPVLFAKKIHKVILISNIGAVIPLSDRERSSQFIVSFAGGINLTPKTITTLEFYRSSFSSFRRNATLTSGIGLMTLVSEKILFYSSFGKTLGDTSDDSTHFNYLAGLKFLFGS